MVSEANESRSAGFISQGPIIQTYLNIEFSQIFQLQSHKADTGLMVHCKTRSHRRPQLANESPRSTPKTPNTIELHIFPTVNQQPSSLQPQNLNCKTRYSSTEQKSYKINYFQYSPKSEIHFHSHLLNAHAYKILSIPFGYRVVRNAISHRCMRNVT